MTSYNPTFKGNCVEVFNVRRKTPACIKFELSMNPERYRGDPTIKAFNSKAQQPQYSEFPLLADELLEYAGNVFTQAVRSGSRNPVREVLGRDADTTKLIPFFELVQSGRDRVVEIQAKVLLANSALITLSASAEEYLVRTYVEVRNLRPEPARRLLIDAILFEIDVRQTQAAQILATCDVVLRNAAAAHSALLEIQAAARNPARLPSIPRSIRKSGGMPEEGGDRKSPIRRKGR